MVRRRDGIAEVLLVHPGGPFWRNKEEHAWSIPKGEIDDATAAGGVDAELAERTARREFVEETGHPVPDGPLVALDEFAVGSGKKLRAFAVAGDLDASSITSNTFEMEWPPRSGRHQTFPEVDEARWVPIAESRSKLHKGQAKLVTLLETLLHDIGW